MSGRSERARRHSHVHMPPLLVEVRMDGTDPWKHWEDVPVVRELWQSVGTEVEQFIVYCVRQGYLKPASGPATTPFLGFEFRVGKTYFQSTKASIAMFLAGAEPTIPVPESLRKLG